MKSYCLWSRQHATFCAKQLMAMESSWSFRVSLKILRPFCDWSMCHKRPSPRHSTSICQKCLAVILENLFNLIFRNTELNQRKINKSVSLSNQVMKMKPCYCSHIPSCLEGLKKSRSRVWEIKNSFPLWSFTNPRMTKIHYDIY